MYFRLACLAAAQVEQPLEHDTAPDTINDNNGSYKKYDDNNRNGNVYMRIRILIIKMMIKKKSSNE